MRRPKRFGTTLLFGIAIAAVHYAVTFLSVAAMAVSAVSSEPSRVPLVVVERLFVLCSLPLRLLPLYGFPWLMLNSVLCGLTLAAVVRWLWSLRKRPL